MQLQKVPAEALFSTTELLTNPGLTYMRFHVPREGTLFAERFRASSPFTLEVLSS